LKQKGVDVKGISKTSVPAVNDEIPPPLLDGGGKLEVLLNLITFSYQVQ
jgi:hypothetical protein